MLAACGPIKNYDQPAEPYFAGNFAPGQQEPAEWIKVITWNLGFAINLDSAIEALTKVKELVNADILLLQEMDEIGVERLAKELGYNYVYYPASVHRRHDNNFGNAVLTNWEIVDHQKFILPKSVPNGKHTRNAVRASIKIGSEYVDAFSVHLETFGFTNQKTKDRAPF